MRCLLVVSGILTVFFVIIIGGLMAVRLLKPVYAVLESGPCQQPCWHGIVFDKTSVDDAEAILRSDPLVKNVARLGPSDDFPCVLTWTMDPLPGWQGCAYASFGNRGNAIGFVRFMVRPNNQELVLTDVLTFMGMPDRVQVCHISSSWLIILHNDQYRLVGRAFDYQPTSAYRLNLYSITIPYIYSGLESQDKRWAGFKDWQRYLTNSLC